ncbi:MAG: glutamate racemase [Desulfobacterales bacterium]|nr:glutamate racemase [Desulfobacterales bacterium]
MIGILDSGIGGLTVAKTITDLLPTYDILYFGDTARAPYGARSARTIIDDTIRNMDFLTGLGAKMVVIACSTTSSVAYAHVAEKFDVPVFEVISPAVASAVETSKNQKFGVIGTRATIESRACEKQILHLRPGAKVFSASGPLLTSLVEEGWVNKPETAMIVKKYLHPLKVRQVDTLILACTHYPVIKNIIQRKIGKQVTLVDASDTVAAHVARFLEKHPEIDSQLTKNGSARFVVSDLTAHGARTAKAIFKKNISLELVAARASSKTP